MLDANFPEDLLWELEWARAREEPMLGNARDPGAMPGVSRDP